MIVIRSTDDAKHSQIASNHRPMIQSITEDIIYIYGDSYDPVEPPYLIYLNDPH